MALKDILANIKQGVNTAQDKLINNLLGTPVQTEPYYGYSKEIEDAKNSLGDLESVQTMLGQPNAKSLEQIQQGFTQGLNYGNPEIAKLQDDLGIAKPDTNNKMQLDMAKSGMFNLPDTLHSSTSNRQGGLINDFVGGLRENYTNAFDAENLAPNANKGAATRFGESIGTALRFFDKPVGRGLLAGAAALALGGGAGDALAYGLGTGVGRQTNMTKDKAYRQGLINMGLDADEVNSIPGIMTDDVFKNLSLSTYRNRQMNYKNMKLDKDTYVKEVRNIQTMLTNGVIDATTATTLINDLNIEYNRQNDITMQEGLKKTLGERAADQKDREIGIKQQNADTYDKSVEYNNPQPKKGGGRPRYNPEAVKAEMKKRGLI